MKRILLIVLFLGAFFGSCFAQMMPDSTVQVIAYWSLGDKYNYQVEEEKGFISGTDTTIVEKSAEILTLEVVDETDSTYTLKVSYDDFQHSDYARMAANEAIEKVYGKTWFNVVTDMNGSFLSIEVPDYFSQAGSTAISEAVNTIAAEKGLSKEERQMAEAVMNAMIKPEAFTAVAIGEIAPLLFFHGARFDLAGEYEYEEDMTSVFGDRASIKAYSSLWVDEDYTDEESVVMRIYREADEDAMRSYIVDLLGTVIQASVPEEDMQDVEEFYDQSSITVEDYIIEEIHLGSGWPLYYRQTRYIDMQVQENLSEQFTRRSVEIIL